jgi:hypothetical protein
MVSVKQDSPQELFQHPELGGYFRYLQVLQPHETPDYGYLRGIFTSQFSETKLVNDNFYDWDMDHEREICKRRTQQMYNEAITNLESQMDQIKTQDRDKLPEIVEKLLDAHRYLLKSQFPTYISVGLRNDKDYLFVIAAGIARLEANCISQMSAPEIPARLIDRAYSDVCAFAELWPGFKNWERLLNSFVKFARLENEEVIGVFLS